jgi:hypothetical protein
MAARSGNPSEPVSSRVFNAVLVFWLVALAIAASDLGGVIGFFVAFGLAIAAGLLSTVLILVSSAPGQELPFDIDPALVLAVVGALILAFALRYGLQGLRAWSHQNRDQARAAWAKGLSVVLAVAVFAVSMMSLERTWPM